MIKWKMGNKDVTYVYDHMGIPTTEKRPGEKYFPEAKMWISGYDDNNFHIQWHRYEEGCPLHPLIQTVAHVAFRVDDLDKAIEGENVILGPIYPLEGYRVAMIEVAGGVIEFLQTDLSEEEIIARTNAKIVG